MFIALALLLSVLVGLSLGLLGGGGSILTLPIFVYALGLEPKQAIATSLVVVAITSLAAVISHARAGRVRFSTALLFGSAGMLGAYGAGLMARFVPANALLLAFAAMMLVTSLAMLRGGRRAASAGEHAAGAKAAPKLMVHGLAVGAVTGFVGAGGGFLIVPALVLLGGLPMHAAVGTSLVVIALNSLAGFTGYMGHVSIDWKLAGLVSGSAVLGSLVGSKLSAGIPQERLRRMFAGFVLAMGVFMVVRQLPEVMSIELDAGLAKETLPCALLLLETPLAQCPVLCIPVGD